MSSQTPVKTLVLEGSAERRGHLLGSEDPGRIRRVLKEYWKKGNTFDTPYFRKNLNFMKREFPGLIEEVRTLGETAGLTEDEAYFTQVYTTGNNTGCSALGLLFLEEGPAMLRTEDVTGPLDVWERDWMSGIRLVIQRGLEPYSYSGIGSPSSLSSSGSVNDRGLILGAASGHPKFNFNDEPETINHYWWPRIIIQHCSDCDDVKSMVRQYRCSGKKGANMVVMDANGNALGVELESENLAFREPEDGMIIETNHFQDPDLVRASLKPREDFWSGVYYLNSMNRLLYLAFVRNRLRSMKHLQEFMDLSFDEHLPGRIIQTTGRNIANWQSVNACFITSRDRTIRFHGYPPEKDRVQTISAPGSGE